MAFAELIVGKWNGTVPLFFVYFRWKYVNLLKSVIS